MYNRNSGIRGILSPPLSEAEKQEDLAAMRAVINKVGPITTYHPVDQSFFEIGASLDKLQAAANKPTVEVRDKDGFTPKQNAEILRHLTRPGDPGAKARSEKRELLEKQKRVKRTMTKLGEVKTIEAAAKPKPMPTVKYIDRINHLYNNNHSEDNEAANNKTVRQLEALKTWSQGKPGPTKQGVKDLQKVTDAVHTQDGSPKHRPEWRWSINRKELVDIKDPNFKGL